MSQNYARKKVRLIISYQTDEVSSEIDTEVEVMIPRRKPLAVTVEVPEDLPQDEVKPEEVSPEEVKPEEVQPEETPVEEVPTQEVPVEEAPVTPIEEAPIEEAPKAPEEEHKPVTPEEIGKRHKTRNLPLFLFCLTFSVIQTKYFCHGIFLRSISCLLVIENRLGII